MRATQPPMVVCKMEAQLEYTHCIHVFALLAPICVLNRCSLTKCLHWGSARKFLRVTLLVGKVLQYSRFTSLSWPRLLQARVHRGRPEQGGVEVLPLVRRLRRRLHPGRDQVQVREARLPQGGQPQPLPLPLGEGGLPDAVAHLGRAIRRPEYLRASDQKFCNALTRLLNLKVSSGLQICNFVKLVPGYLLPDDKMGNVKLIGRVTCPEDNKVGDARSSQQVWSGVHFRSTSIAIAGSEVLRPRGPPGGGQARPPGLRVPARRRQRAQPTARTSGMICGCLS